MKLDAGYVVMMTWIKRVRRGGLAMSERYEMIWIDGWMKFNGRICFDLDRDIGNQG